MKRVLFTIILHLFIGIVAAQENLPAILKKLEKLEQEQKYLTAFQVCDSIDPSYVSASLVLFREKIALNYFVSSDAHIDFGIMDIPKGKSHLDFRGSDLEEEVFRFEIPRYLDSLLKKNPGNCALLAGKGNYYFEVYTIFGEKWIEPATQVMSRMKSAYDKAAAKGCKDAKVFYHLGYLELEQGKYKEGIPWLRKSLAVNPAQGIVDYNLGFSYFKVSRFDSALYFAREAFKHSGEKSLKLSSAILAATSAEKLKDGKSALEFYKAASANDTSPVSYYKAIIFYSNEIGNREDSIFRERYYKIGSENPEFYNDLESAYLPFGKGKALLDFYGSKLKENQENTIIRANLLFFSGRLLLDTNKARARESFLQAGEIFKSQLPPGHTVFKALEEALALTSE